MAARVPGGLTGELAGELADELNGGPSSEPSRGLSSEPGDRPSDRLSHRPAAAVRQLTRRFGDRTVLDRLDLEIAGGEFVALLGRSGSGKSTLLRALAGLDQEIDGSLTVAGSVAVAFQEPRLVPWKRVRANVALGLGGPDPLDRADTALAEVGLAERSGAWPLTLSGGEAQRASLARALVREPSLLLLDEPFSALDALTRITMHGLVLELWAAHRPAVLLVTHDVDEALLLADRVLVLDAGRVAHETVITTPRPRHRDHPDLIALRATLLAALGVSPEGTT
ncbi:ABC transporter ATP-binding protein [Microbispora sp. RL4-1S]|uniref:ABC transporter ATP-binding protein n=1 Tax=Microbispora oryzae TaxID=2806554 RepID=A0A940WBE9_9ACTN|nr:ABC transporter ATP-binding protein [Microbispora oryzae]MBP2702376.1 ABC transporter ATP-binding protein [Microbispora oryzae]